MIIITIFFVSICALYIYSLWTYSYWRKRKIPYPKPVALFGNIKEVIFLRQYTGHCHQEIYRMFPDEKLVGVYQLHRPSLLIRDSELVKQCLVKDFNHFTDRGFHFDENREPLTGNLVNLCGQRWRLLRAKLTPAFSSGKIKQMFPLLQLCSDQLRIFIQSELSKSDVLEMREVSARFTTDVIGTVAFGLQFESMTGDSIFREMGKKALNPSGMVATARAMRAFTPWLYDLFKLRTFPNQVNEFFIGVVQDTMKQRIESGYQRNDFLQLMIQLKDATQAMEPEKEDIAFTDQVIAAQAFIFFLAGFETSSTTLSYCLYELSKNPECQEKLYKEILDMLKKYEELTYDGIMEMSYLEQVLLETMRLYPPVGNLSRVCTKPYIIPGTDILIEEGVGLVIPVFALHHDPLIWPDPESFKPERFIDRELQKAPYYLPFGAGPRVCIGQRFAMLEMKVALTRLIQDYIFTPSSRSLPVLDVDPKSFIMAPLDGIWLTLKPRPWIEPDFISSHL